MALHESTTLHQSFPHASASPSEAEIGEQLLQHVRQASHKNGDAERQDSEVNGKEATDVEPSEQFLKPPEGDAEEWAEHLQRDDEFGTEESQDRDSDPRYAPIKNPPSQGQVCR